MSSRRAHGEGSYDYNEKGDYWRWRGYYTKNGEKKRKEIVAKSRKKLRAKVEEFQNELESGSVCEGVTVARWCNIWLEEIVKTSVKIRTYENYKCTIDNHIVTNFGKIKLKDLQVMQLQRFFNELAKTHAVSTISTIRNHFILLLNSAVEYSYISANVAKRTKPPARVKIEIEILDDEQINKLLYVATEGKYIYYSTKQFWNENEGMIFLRKSYYVVLMLALTAGMRQGEIFGLKWENIDLEQSKLRVASNMVTSKSQGQLLSTTKTVSSMRNILLPRRTVEALKKWKMYQQGYAKKWAGIYKNMQDLVFPNSFGKLTSISNFNKRYFKKMLAAAEISNTFTFHCLRHTHATQLLKAGVNVKVVAERLGHSNTSTTMNIYAHALPNMQKMAVDELDKIY